MHCCICEFSKRVNGEKGDEFDKLLHHYIHYLRWICEILLPRLLCKFDLDYAMKCVPPQVIKGAEILEVLHSLPTVRQYLFSLYECRYSVFFQSLGEEPFSFIDLNNIETLQQTNTLYTSHL